jgi:hypothetical protein
MEIGNGLCPHLTPERVVGQALNVLGESLRVASLDGLDRPGVESTSALLQEASIRHLVSQRVLERVLDIGEQARLVEELGRLEPGEAPGQHVGGSSGDTREHGHRDVGADHGGGLKKVLVLHR